MIAIRRLNNSILYTEGLSKGMQATKSVYEIKCINEKMTWNTQDTNLRWYVPKANMDDTIYGQGTARSTLGHSFTTPRSWVSMGVVCYTCISLFHCTDSIIIRWSLMQICPSWDVSLTCIRDLVFVIET